MEIMIRKSPGRQLQTEQLSAEPGSATYLDTPWATWRHVLMTGSSSFSTTLPLVNENTAARGGRGGGAHQFLFPLNCDSSTVAGTARQNKDKVEGRRKRKQGVEE
jgi:hypothetical protein